MAIPQDDADWLRLIRAGMPPFWRMVADGCGGQVIEEQGVFAAIVPESPRRSFFNSVLYEDAESLLENLDRLAGAYEEAGISAWTVWVPEGDERAAAGLERAGHVLDARPRAMAMPLAGLRLPDPDPELELLKGQDLAEVSRINEIAYGFPPGDFPVIGGDPPGLWTYIGRLDGEAVGCAGGFVNGTDCVLIYVAVLPEARGRGVAAQLSGRMLADAAEQGLETTTLQATKLGFPVYNGLGYADYGELQMWERRK